MAGNDDNPYDYNELEFQSIDKTDSSGLNRQLRASTHISSSLGFLMETEKLSPEEIMDYLRIRTNHNFLQSEESTLQIQMAEDRFLEYLRQKVKK